MRYPSQNSAYKGNAGLLLINEVAYFRRCLLESTPETDEESEAEELEADETVMDEEDKEGEDSEVISTDESEYDRKNILIMRQFMNNSRYLYLHSVQVL